MDIFIVIAVICGVFFASSFCAFSFCGSVKGDVLKSVFGVICVGTLIAGVTLFRWYVLFPWLAGIYMGSVLHRQRRNMEAMNSQQREDPLDFFGTLGFHPSQLASNSPESSPDLETIPMLVNRDYYEYEKAPACCPSCGHEPVAKVSYGTPSRIDTAAIEAGHIILGGSCIFPDSPAWMCSRCHQPLHLKQSNPLD